jgi:hypothetical protein
MRAVVIFILFLGGLARAQDFQQWNEFDLAGSWQKVEFTLPFLARTDSQLPNPQLAATGLLADFHLPWRLTLTGGYLFADLAQTPYKVTLPLIAVTETVHVGRFSIADRNRLEKLFGYPTEPVRYRNRILLDRALGARNRWHLFVDNEIFFNLTNRSWNQNRFQAGGGARLNRRLLVDVYYLQRNPSGGAATTRVLGSTLRVSFARRVRAAEKGAEQ